MCAFDLYWRVFPACVYEYLEKFEGKARFYDPILGPGVYLFIHANGRRYQVYYVGQSDEMGRRLAAHFADYAHARQSDYWLPTKEDAFDREDLYDLFRQDASETFAQQGPGFSREARAKVGARMMRDTYFAFAGMAADDIARLRDVEATLQAALAKRHNLPLRGWLGEKTSVVPKEDIVVRNLYPDDVARKMISPSIPEEIRAAHGVIVQP